MRSQNESTIYAYLTKSTFTPCNNTISDISMRSSDRPAITYGTRGQLSLGLTVHGPQHDLHSGTFGGAVHNPLQALSDIIAKLHALDCLPASDSHDFWPASFGAFQRPIPGHLRRLPH